MVRRSPCHDGFTMNGSGESSASVVRAHSTVLPVREVLDAQVCLPLPTPKNAPSGGSPRVAAFRASLCGCVWPWPKASLCPSHVAWQSVFVTE